MTDNHIATTTYLFYSPTSDKPITPVGSGSRDLFNFSSLENGGFAKVPDGNKSPIRYTHEFTVDKPIKGDPMEFFADQIPEDSELKWAGDAAQVERNSFYRPGGAWETPSNYVVSDWEPDDPGDGPD